MNSLSWFLYLADVIGNVQGVLVTLSVILTMATFPWLICKLIGDDSYNKKEKEIAKAFSFVPWLALAAATLAAIIPSKETIYLIAGSEAGEAVVASETGQEILNDIKEVIQHQLSELKGTTEKSSATP